MWNLHFNGYKDKNLPIEEYLNKIKPYLKDIMIDLQKSDTWKIHLATAINFISFKETDEEWTTHSENDNIEVMIYGNLDKIIEELFELVLSRYQISLETQMRGNNTVFDR